jgi:type IV pilus assembly protein PilM
MGGLTTSRPRHCLKIGAQTLAWGEAVRTWRGRYRYRCVLSPTPTGAIKLSPMDLNLTDMAAVKSRLRLLAGPSRDIRFAGRVWLSDVPRPIVLLLPDLSVRSTVLQLEQLPAQAEEQEALIRWRLGQEQLLPLAGAKIVWQGFPSHGARDERSHVVLVVAIQEAILKQYESLCESVGLLPQEVGVTSFRLFNLWLKAAGGRKRLGRDLLWVSVSDGGLTCFVMQEGRLAFVRTKLLSAEGLQGEEGHGADLVDKVVEECAASLRACRENHPGLNVTEMVLAGDSAFPTLEQALNRELGLSTERLDWEAVERGGWTHDGGSTSWATLPVVAGVM